MLQRTDGEGGEDKMQLAAWGCFVMILTKAFWRRAFLVMCIDMQA